MILISHRGNVDGPNSKLENKPSYIEKAIKLGFDAEIDVWFTDGWYLGHNEPQYKITKKWLLNLSDLLWIHCKNIEALYQFVNKDNYTEDSSPNYFWHQTDDFALTSHRFVWTFSGKELTPLSVCVLPEKHYSLGTPLKCFGICSDYIMSWKVLD